MIDFLRSNTWCSQEEYKWQMSIPQVHLASMDFTHIEYLSDKDKKDDNTVVVNGADDLRNLSDLGIPII